LVSLSGSRKAKIVSKQGKREATFYFSELDVLSDVLKDSTESYRGL
jgi:hypothetical protein